MANLDEIFSALNSEPSVFPDIYSVRPQTPEILQSIDNSAKSIDDNGKAEIAELKQQNEKLQTQIDFAKKEAKSSKIESHIAIGISVIAIIVDILLYLFK